MSKLRGQDPEQEQGEYSGARATAECGDHVDNLDRGPRQVNPWPTKKHGGTWCRRLAHPILGNARMNPFVPAARRIPPAVIHCVAGMMLCIAATRSVDAQPLRLAPAAEREPALLDTEVRRLAIALLAQPDGLSDAARSLRQLTDRAYLQLAANDSTGALASLRTIAARSDAPRAADNPALVLLTARAEAGMAAPTFERALRQRLTALSDRDAFEVGWYLETPFFVFERNLASAVSRATTRDSLSNADAITLVRSHVMQRALQALESSLPEVLAAENTRRYLTDTAVLVRTREGITLSAVVVRPRRTTTRQPTAFNFTIYTNSRQHLETARRAASHGYVGVVADARGKRLSRDTIRPYEAEANDTHAVLDWIAAQPWSDGRIGMYGASYEGFTAWAATKRKHPALRTIVVSAAAIPGQGVPMENNVFLTANYAWPFYVSNNRELDNDTYFDRNRWNQLAERWYESGRPFRDIDQVDGTPNPLLQRWLTHPTFDSYWQRMVPYGADFARIDIPVLSITGYFDDGQISALHYVREHMRYRPDAAHYLVIGPYDHGGAGAARKSAEVRGHVLDSVAQFNTTTLTFAWLDHVLRGAPRPALLADKVNHQVMGANVWRHAPSLAALAERPLRLYPTAARDGAHFTLDTARKDHPGIVRIANMADRTTQHVGYYPVNVLGPVPEFGDALTFVSAPFSAPTEVSGAISGSLEVITNTRDFDFNVVLYELLPDGRVFHLSYYLGRASHVRDLAQRKLLVPGQQTTLPFTRSRMTSRRMQAGSRLLLVIDVNKDAGHQVNHGTGGDVSAERASDAVTPMSLRLMPGSFVDVPVRRP
ncbi:putative hydrolase [Gemmatimonas aurantiaca T-27]|nr:putative hydrolase [Gemmatimonas aurantiaca T-27]